MNATEHLLTCLAEEACEVAHDVHKNLRFGLDDRNVLEPAGPTNRERLIGELNDLLGVANMLVDLGVLPPDWRNADRQIEKARKVAKFMNYAVHVGALSQNCDYTTGGSYIETTGRGESPRDDEGKS